MTYLRLYETAPKLDYRREKTDECNFNVIRNSNKIYSATARNLEQ